MMKSEPGNGDDEAVGSLGDGYSVVAPFVGRASSRRGCEAGDRWITEVEDRRKMEEMENDDNALMNTKLVMIRDE